MAEPIVDGRIAHVITESNLGGAQRNTLLSVQGLLAAGLEVDLVCGPGGPLPDVARAAGARAYLLPDLVRAIDPVRDVRAVVRLWRLFRERRYDIVHTHCTKAGWLGRAAAWWAGVPVIVHTVHGAPFELGPDLRTRVFVILESLASRVSDRLICVGETFRRQVAGWGIAPESKLVTIYSGVDREALRPRRSVTEVKRELRLEEAWPIVGSVGRLTEAKALHDLIAAIGQLRSHYPRIRLILVGDGPLRADLEHVARRCGCADAVVFLGEREDVPDLLETFDVYAMSSRWEGVGRALTEAMLTARPVVATDVGGVAELVVDGRTGLLQPPGDPTSLAAAIDRIVSDPELAHRLGAAAHDRTLGFMGGDQMIDALRALYAKLLESARHRGRQAARAAAPLETHAGVERDGVGGATGSC